MKLRKFIIIGSIVLGIVLAFLYVSLIKNWDSLGRMNSSTRAPENVSVAKDGSEIVLSGKGSKEDIESLIKQLSDMMEPPKETGGKDGTEKEAKWMEFRSSEGEFSVLLPNTPTKDTLRIADKPISFHSVSGDYKYTVVYEDIPEETQGANTTFDKAINLNLDGVKQLSQSNISVNGLPGREAVMEITGSGWMMKQRWFLANGKSYFLSAQFPKGEVSSNIAKVDRFLDSFRVLDQDL